MSCVFAQCTCCAPWPSYFIVLDTGRVRDASREFYERIVLALPAPLYGWYRAFERLRREAAAPALRLLVARVWRRLRCADACQARRRKRRRFVQRLAMGWST